ncbi:hypothetical protein Nepgr_003399 [Nepenthes gracilis]|uniref:Chloroplast sensor kinase, chloroplastic n=1 Tax=Nepenthes gracilis TaxID=150966 RepID=A0AAD3XDR9_NEPGR|nr:hypothetical protein Nepgr_003399 [Nepenthes gracilis]
MTVPAKYLPSTCSSKKQKAWEEKTMLSPCAVTTQIWLTNPNTNNTFTLVCYNYSHHNYRSKCYASTPKQLVLAKSTSSLDNETSLENPNFSPLRYVNNNVSDGPEGGGAMVSSASAVASAIRKASTSPVEFMEKIERDTKGQRLVLPSPDFQRLCLDQLDLFRRIVDPNALLSVYVRPAGSYVMDQLELRRVAFYPKVDVSDIIVLVGNFSIPTGLRAAEAALSSQEVEAISDHKALVFPMVKHPFVVGFLVAELPNVELGKESHNLTQFPSPSEHFALPPSLELKSQEIQISSGNALKLFNFSAEKRLNAINISRSLAMAYVMDQKAMLLQQTSWQNNIRMNNLVEQIRGSLSSIQTLIKMLSIQMKRSEISYDIVEDIIVQGDQMQSTLQQLQDAVYLTKANILRFNEVSLKKMQGLSNAQPGLTRQQLPNDTRSDTSVNKRHFGGAHSLSSAVRDIEVPMPPLALSPLKQHHIRPCNVSDVLADLIEAVKPLARKQKRIVEYNELSRALQVAVEEPALRQALGNLIEGALLRTNVGGKVEIVSVGAPAGGALVVIDDDGPDMHYMTQMHSLTPFGAELFSEQMVEDNMTWNFVAGLTIAREILESYGCVVRVISPRTMDAALGAGGTHIEVWLPVLTGSSDKSSAALD